MNYAITVLTVDNSCLTAGCFKQRTHKFFLVMLNATPKQVGETQQMNVMNKYCDCCWCNQRGIR